MRIMLLISQDHWTYTVRWGHNRLCGRVCSVAHWYRKLSFYHATHFPIDTEFQDQYVQDFYHMKEFPHWLWPCFWDLVVVRWGGSRGFPAFLNAQKDTVSCIFILHIYQFSHQWFPHSLQDFDCSGKSMGVYEHPDQCNMYYVCTSEGRVRK